MFETICGDVHISTRPGDAVGGTREVGGDGRLREGYVLVHCAARSLALLGALPAPSHLTSCIAVVR